MPKLFATLGRESEQFTATVQEVTKAKSAIAIVKSTNLGWVVGRFRWWYRGLPLPNCSPRKYRN